MVPILKFVGGKAWFVKSHGSMLLEYLQRRGGRFIEPFFGGGAMGLHIGSYYPKAFVVGDVIEPLVEFYQVIQKDPVKLAYTVAQICIEYGLDEKAYYAVREEEPDEPLLRAARFLYLNKAGFNGLHRENAAGKFNVPAGSAAKAGKTKMPERGTYEAVSKALTLADIRLSDFEALIDEAEERDWIYCDSPYAGEGFTDYAKNGFGLKDQERLAMALYRASERGVTFLAHNSLTGSVEEEHGVKWWYEDFATVIPFDEPRRVSANGNRDDAKCCLVTNSPELAEKLRP